MSDSSPRLPAGRQPYDPLNGFRIGALTGGILGVVVMGLTHVGNVWLVGIGAAAGGAIGFLTERRKVEREADGLPPTDD